MAQSGSADTVFCRSITEVNLARVPGALEDEAKEGSSLEGAGKGRLWRKGSRKGVD